MPEFNFLEDYVLENQNVLLRPLLLSDFKNLVHFSINEPEIWKYNPIKTTDLDYFKNYLQTAINARESKLEYPFIVYDKIQSKYAGSTRFYDIQISQKRFQLGYTWYGKAFQGTGLNRDCKFLLLQFAVEQLQLERVEFRANNANTKSIAAMRSIGCKEEGVLRNYNENNEGTRIDAIVLSILKSEWCDSVKENLETRLRQ
jgi:N-acetyltransferase